MESGRSDSSEEYSLDSPSACTLISSSSCGRPSESSWWRFRCKWNGSSLARKRDDALSLSSSLACCNGRAQLRIKGKAV